MLFLAVQNSSIGDLVTHWVTDWLTDWVTFTFAIQRAILETCYHCTMRKLFFFVLATWWWVTKGCHTLSYSRGRRKRYIFQFQFTSIFVRFCLLFLPYNADKKTLPLSHCCVSFFLQNVFLFLDNIDHWSHIFMIQQQEHNYYLTICCQCHICHLIYKIAWTDTETDVLK